MDPLTVIATALTLGGVVEDVTEKLYAFISGARVVDETVQGLYSEIQSLGGGVAAVQTSLTDPVLNRHQRSKLWTDVDACLQACRTTISRFKEQLDGLPAAKGRKNFFKDALKQFKLGLRQDEMTTLRAQVQSHIATLQLMLSMIVVHISSSTHHVAVEEISSKLDLLNEKMEKFSLSALPEADGQNDYIIRSSQELEVSAKALASHTSEIIGVRSTVWGGSELDLADWKSTRDRADGEDGPDLETISKPILDSDDELQLQLIGSYHSLGRQKYDEKAYAEAEGFLRRATEALETCSAAESHTTVDPHEIRLLLASTCFHQDKLADAQALYEPMIHKRTATDNQRAQALDASLMLAKVHFRSGNLAAAEKQCRQTIVGFQRLQGETPVYFESLALMVSILEAQDDSVQVAAWKTMLPADYQFPEFRPPPPKDSEERERKKIKLTEISEAPKIPVRNEDIATWYGRTDPISDFQYQWAWKGIEQHAIQNIENCKRTLGEDDPHTIASVSHLAQIYKLQERYDRAEQLELQVMEASKRINGPNNPDTLRYMINLSKIYRERRKFKKAEDLGSKAVDISMRLFGEESDDTHMSQDFLAETYGLQGKWDKVEAIMAELVETKRRVFGDKNLSTLRSMIALSEAYCAQKKFKDVERFQIELNEAMDLSIDKDDTFLRFDEVVEHNHRQRKRQVKLRQLTLRQLQVRLQVRLQELQTKRRSLGEEHPDAMAIIAAYAATRDKISVERMIAEQLEWT